MTKTNFLRNVVAIAICLTATTISVQAQLGGALNRARSAAGQATQNVPSTVTEKATQVATTQMLSSEQQNALAKLLDESKRTAPKVKELSDYQRDYELIRNWFGKAESKSVGDVQTKESAQAFKAAIEARTAENREIFCALFQVPANYDCSKLTDDYDFGFRGNAPSIKDEVRSANDAAYSAGDNLKQELENYQMVLSLAADLVPRGKIEGDIQTGAAITIDDLRAGLFRVRQKDGQLVFYDVNGLIAPCENAQFVRECTKLDVVQTLLKKENSETQSDQYWLALTAIQRLVQAQRNSMSMQEKVPVPASQMNNATLNAKMLKLAQQKYPDMGIVKIIIIESAWRPQQNALGQIIHRLINTRMIYPRGNGYIMTTLSFMEPYAGNGNYGETQAYGIGTDSAAVDYKP